MGRTLGPSPTSSPRRPRRQSFPSSRPPFSCSSIYLLASLRPETHIGLVLRGATILRGQNSSLIHEIKLGSGCWGQEQQELLKRMWAVASYVHYHWETVLGQNTSRALIIGRRWRRIKALKGNKFPGRFTKTRFLEVSTMGSARPLPSPPTTVNEKAS